MDLADREDSVEDDEEDEALLERDLDFERDTDRLETEGDLERPTDDLDELEFDLLLPERERLRRVLVAVSTGVPERLECLEQGLRERFREFGLLCVLPQPEFVCKIGMRVLSIMST